MSDFESQRISNEAISWVKLHQKEIIEKFGGLDTAATQKPVSIFMAGSPGAGKTEFSKHLIGAFEDNELYIVRIDPDEIRQWFPFYIHGRADLFQSAVSIAVEKIHDHVLKKNKNFLLDGTLSNFEIAHKNIQRSVEKGRSVFIEYVFQEPLVAWDFTKKREAVEGRNIPKKSFIEQLFSAYENADRLKAIFEKNIELDLIQRNIQTGKYSIQFDISQIETNLHIGYTADNLEKLI